MMQILVITTFTGRSQQVELGFLVHRQTCPSIRIYLDMLFDCQPGESYHNIVVTYCVVSWCSCILLLNLGGGNRCSLINGVVVTPASRKLRTYIATDAYVCMTVKAGDI